MLDRVINTPLYFSVSQAQVLTYSKKLNTSSLNYFLFSYYAFYRERKNQETQRISNFQKIKTKLN